MFDEIIKEVAEELGEDKRLVESIIRQQFSFIRRHISVLSLRGIRLPYFGLFVLKDSKIPLVKSGKITPLTTEEYSKFSRKQKEYKRRRIQDDKL